ncbi:MAG: type II secretion system GspH family protein [Synergistaceae bacterium]|jgi:general secretion pathway protein G|nr:type II secretion system GspH family protein [Synergistaceae bacterium]
MKARKGGFTLVELLIVIMIIAILAGMMLLATGSATDSAEATKVINDLRNLKSAALLFYGDNLRWPNSTEGGSLDRYADRPVDTTRYTVVIGAEYTDSQNTPRANIGVTLVGDNNKTVGVQKKLAGKATDTGLFQTDSTDTAYTTGTSIYMNMR